MSKVCITIRRSLQNKLPFLGKIVFTLEGDNSELITSFIPEVGFFYRGQAYAHLVPNEEIEGTTYYHYAIYAQGHIRGVFLSEPVEEGICLVPDHDCNLDDIISPIPDKETANEIVAKASSMMAEIKSALEQAKECMRKSCEAAASTRNLPSLVQEVQTYYNWTKSRQEEIENEFSSFEELLHNYETNLKQQIKNIFYENTQELLSSIKEEQLLINDLWEKILDKFQGAENIGAIQEAIQHLNSTYVAEITRITNKLNQIDEALAKKFVHICGEKTTLSQLPSTGNDGDIWLISSKDNAIYMWYANSWHHITTKRQADTIEVSPQNSFELAAVAALLEEGAHLTVLFHNLTED